jgi:hypothetical protein
LKALLFFFTQDLQPSPLPDSPGQSSDSVSAQLAAAQQGVAAASRMTAQIRQRRIGSCATAKLLQAKN